MKMIQIGAKAEDIPDIISNLQKNGIQGMTRLKITGPDKNFYIPACIPVDNNISWEIVFTVIPDHMVFSLLTSLNIEFDFKKVNDFSLFWKDDIFFSVSDVEKEFDIN